jgi:beta propeller repeat protein
MDGTRMRRILAAGLALTLLLGLSGVGSTSLARTFAETRITDEAAWQARPSIWGDTIVWYDDRNNVGVSRDLYVYDISEQQETRLTTSGDVDDPDVYGDIIVWTENRDGDYDVFMYDRSTGTETPITSDTFRQSEVVVYRDTIVWDDDRHNPGGAPSDIYMYDIPTGTETRVTNAVAANQRDPDIHGMRFAWSDDRDNLGASDEVYLFDILGGQEDRLTVAGVDAEDPAVWGDLVAWEEGTGNKNVTLRDLATGVTTPLTSDPSDQDDPDVFRHLVAWEDNRHTQNEIYLYDVEAGSEERVTNAAFESINPRIWGNKIVFEDSRGHSGNWNDIWMASFGLEPARSGGATRYGTAAAVSGAHFAQADTVVVATGADFADALAASGLAGVYGGSLLLTLPDQLSPEAAAEIQRLGADTAVIVGGEGAVGPDVATQLAGLGLTVERIGGADRYETASLIAQEIGTQTGPRFEQTAFIARGDEFADALAVSPAAYYNRFPILLTRTEALPPVTEQALTALDIETAVVAGGPGAVSTDVQVTVNSRLAANGGAPSERWAGPTRYETAEAVASGSCDRYWAGPGYVGLAVGDNFPDALAGGAGAGIEFGVLLLTRTDELPAAAEAFLSGNRGAVGWLEALGGTAVVSDQVVDTARQATE